MELEMLCRISSCGAMNSVSKCFTFFLPTSTWFRRFCSVLLLLFAVVVAVVGSKAIHKHFTFMPKIRLQSECEKWEVRTETDTRVQWHQNQSQSSFHQRETFFPCMRSKWSVNAVTEISIHLIFYLYLMRIVCVMHVFWDVINVDTRLEDLRGITAIIINIITLQHSHTNTSNFWFLKEELNHLMQCIHFMRFALHFLCLFTHHHSMRLIFFLSPNLLREIPIVEPAHTYTVRVLSFPI